MTDPGFKQRFRWLKEKLGAGPKLSRSTKDTAGRAAEKAKAAAWRGRERLEGLWEPEDPAELLRTSPLFRPLHEAGGALDPRLASLRWRNEALLLLSAAGLFTFERDIIAVTDALFHKGLPSPGLSERLFGQDFAGLHRWIDTVPGSSVAGGGVTHRVPHWHDLAAAAEV
jgi:hypothetical protein